MPWDDIINWVIDNSGNLVHNMFVMEIIFKENNLYKEIDACIAYDTYMYISIGT